MTEQEKKDIAFLINDNKQPILDKNISEWLFRALVGLLLFLGNNIRLEQQNQGKDLADVKAAVSQINTKNQYYYKDVENFKDILSKPRFTKEDFDINTSPIVKQLNSNTAEMNSRSVFMKETEKRLTKLEYQIIELIDFKKNKKT